MVTSACILSWLIVMCAGKKKLIERQEPLFHSRLIQFQISTFFGNVQKYRSLSAYRIIEYSKTFTNRESPDQNKQMHSIYKTFVTILPNQHTFSPQPCVAALTSL